MTALSRRRMLRGGGAGLAVVATSALTLAPAALGQAEADPVVMLGMEADKRFRFAEQPHDSDEAQAAASERWFEYVDRIAATPATSAAGVAVKLRIVQYDMEAGDTNYTDAIMTGAIADLDRLGRSVSNSSCAANWWLTGLH